MNTTVKFLHNDIFAFLYLKSIQKVIVQKAPIPKHVTLHKTRYLHENYFPIKTTSMDTLLTYLNKQNYSTMGSVGIITLIIFCRIARILNRSDIAQALVSDRVLLYP